MNEEKGKTEDEDVNCDNNKNNNQGNENNDNVNAVSTGDCAKPTIKCKKIGNYILANTIGRGTFSKVKVGIHLPTGQKVAIKILDKAKIKDEKDVERISREIHILKKLRHENLGQLYDTVTSNKHIYLVMEYAEGRDLYEYINSRKLLNEVKACQLFQQLIAAVEYIHKLGVVHRDIKPENILLDYKHERLKLVDFGLSNSYKGDELIKTACGSPCYAAPEMIKGLPYHGLMSDIWSCGVVLFSMLCGFLPFDDNNIKRLYKKISEGDYKIPKFVSPSARNLIENILVVDPVKRYNLNNIKAHGWFKLSKPELDQGIIVGIDDILIDEEIITKVKELKMYRDNVKITHENIRESLKKNSHNNVTTAYYLLHKGMKTEDDNKEENQEDVNKDSLIPHNGDDNWECNGKSQIAFNSISDVTAANQNNLANNIKSSAKKNSIRERDTQTPYRILLNSLINKNNAGPPSTDKKNNTKELYNKRLSSTGTTQITNTINNIQNQTIIPTEINKNVNVLVINNIVTNSPSSNSPLFAHHLDLNRLAKLNLTIKDNKINVNATNNVNQNYPFPNKNKLNISNLYHNFIKSKQKKNSLMKIIIKKGPIDNKNKRSLTPNINQSNEKNENEKIISVNNKPNNNNFMINKLTKNKESNQINNNKSSNKINKFIFMSPEASASDLYELDQLVRNKSYSIKKPKINSPDISNNVISPKSPHEELSNKILANLNKVKVKQLLNKSGSILKSNSGAMSLNLKILEDNKSNYLTYQKFNQNLLKGKLKMVTKGNSNISKGSNNASLDIKKLPMKSNNKTNISDKKNNYSHLRRIYDNESFNFENSSVYQKNENSMNSSNANAIMVNRNKQRTETVKSNNEMPKEFIPLKKTTIKKNLQEIKMKENNSCKERAESANKVASDKGSVVNERKRPISVSINTTINEYVTYTSGIPKVYKPEFLKSNIVPVSNVNTSGPINNNNTPIFRKFNANMKKSSVVTTSNNNSLNSFLNKSRYVSFGSNANDSLFLNSMLLTQGKQA